MPAKLRAPKERRPPPFDPEVLALFRELDATPMRARESDAFKARSRELARALGLENEWFLSQCSVLDRSALPNPPLRLAEEDMHAVRRVRNALLAAVKDTARDRLPANPAEFDR
jgi:hypothetical protein